MEFVQDGQVGICLHAVTDQHIAPLSGVSVRFPGIAQGLARVHIQWRAIVFCQLGKGDGFCVQDAFVELKVWSNGHDFACSKPGLKSSVTPPCPGVQSGSCQAGILARRTAAGVRGALRRTLHVRLTDLAWHRTVLIVLGPVTDRSPPSRAPGRMPFPAT